MTPDCSLSTPIRHAMPMILEAKLMDTDTELFRSSWAGKFTTNFRLGVIACLAVLGLSLGCGGPDADDLLAAANETNIQRLANLYVVYQSRHDWRGPSDEAEFKAFLHGWNPRKLSNIGVDPATIDDVFVSSRDGETFKVRYGVPGNIMGSDAAVVFESTGVGGKRMVGFLNMTKREVDEAEYKGCRDRDNEHLS